MAKPLLVLDPDKLTMREKIALDAAGFAVFDSLFMTPEESGVRHALAIMALRDRKHWPTLKGYD